MTLRFETSRNGLHLDVHKKDYWIGIIDTDSKEFVFLDSNFRLNLNELKQLQKKIETLK